MDYKYIEQLLERYWRCETSMEEEDILRTFFRQDNLPEEMKAFQPLFAYTTSERSQAPLGDDFDERLMRAIGEDEALMPVKARTISLSQRLQPLFKAAAVVAIVLSVSMAAQMSFRNGGTAASQMTEAGVQRGASVALSADTAKVDSMKQSNLDALPTDAPATERTWSEKPILK